MKTNILKLIRILLLIAFVSVAIFMAKKNDGNVAIILMAIILLSILVVSIAICCEKKNNNKYYMAYSFNMFYKKLLLKYPKLSILGEDFKIKLYKAYVQKHKKVAIKVYVSLVFVFIVIIVAICLYFVL